MSPESRAEEPLLESGGRRAPTLDSRIEAAGGFGRAQACILAFSFAVWLVHGLQVMSMAFVGPAAAAEYAAEGKVVRLTGSFFFAGWFVGLSLWSPRDAAWMVGRLVLH